MDVSKGGEMRSGLLRIAGYVLLAPLVAVSWLSVLRIDAAPQYIAQLTLELVGPAILLFLLLGCILTYRRWRIARRPGFMAVFGIAVSGLLAITFTLGSQIVAASRQGITIDPLRAIVPSTQRDHEEGWRHFVYDRYKGEAAALHVLRAAKSNRPAPILVYVHGGGWIEGSALARAADLRWYSEKGYLVVGVDYALSSSGRALWNTTQPQIACALAWVAREGPGLGGDPTRMVLFGESAGANLAMQVGNLAATGALASRCGGRVPKSAAVVAIYPPTDIAALWRHDAARRFAVAYTGGSPAQVPQRYAAVSPTRTLATTNPPTLIISGTDDSLVPFRDTAAYVKRAERIGAPVKLVTIPRAGHGFDILPGSIGSQIFRGAASHFLQAQGMLP